MTRAEAMVQVATTPRTQGGFLRGDLMRNTINVSGFSRLKCQVRENTYALDQRRGALLTLA